MTPGRPAPVPESVSPVKGLLASTLGETIDIEVLPAPDLWPCEVDPAQLESAILNLSINARDAMPSGGRLVLEASNATVDESSGLAVEDLEREVAAEGVLQLDHGMLLLLV